MTAHDSLPPSRVTVSRTNAVRASGGVSGRRRIAVRNFACVFEMFLPPLAASMAATMPSRKTEDAVKFTSLPLWRPRMGRQYRLIAAFAPAPSSSQALSASVPKKRRTTSPTTSREKTVRPTGEARSNLAGSCVRPHGCRPRKTDALDGYPARLRPVLVDESQPPLLAERAPISQARAQATRSEALLREADDVIASEADGTAAS